MYYVVLSYILFTVNKSLAAKPIAIFILEERQLGNPSFIERVKPYLDLIVYDKKTIYQDKARKVYYVETYHNSSRDAWNDIGKMKNSKQG